MKIVYSNIISIESKNAIFQVFNQHKISNTTASYLQQLYRKSRLKVLGFKNVIISSIGSIHSECWNITTKGGCKCNYLPLLHLNKRILNNVYDKVVSISHNWCRAVFHSIVECLVKLGYYIPELLIETAIKIHTIKSVAVKYLFLLGFNSSRIVYGNIYVTKLLILEKGSCGSPPPIIHLHSINYYLRSKIKSKKIYDIILVKRYGIREIINHNDVYNALIIRFSRNRIAIFYPNTSFSNTLNYFKYAKLIVAPHGAGLSNIIVSSKCIVIEYLINNLCYSSLSKKLGLDYYGIYETTINGKFFVNITMLHILIKDIQL